MGFISILTSVNSHLSIIRRPIFHQLFVLFFFFRLPNGHINFEKFWQLAHQISEFIEWKRTVCPFPKDLHIITFLQASPVLSEKGKTVLKVHIGAGGGGLFCVFETSRAAVGIRWLDDLVQNFGASNSGKGGEGLK